MISLTEETQKKLRYIMLDAAENIIAIMNEIIESTYEEGIEQGENNLSDDYDRGYDDGYVACAEEEKR